MMTTYITFDKRSGEILSAHHGAIDAKDARAVAHNDGHIRDKDTETISIPSDSLGKLYRVDVGRKVLVAATVQGSGVGFEFGAADGSSLPPIAKKASFLTNIEAIVGDGKAVISGDGHNILAVVQATIRSGKSASFYLSRDQANALREWYWTPERVEASGLKMVSSEEKARIESELGIENIGSFRCSSVECNCGHVYGAFEFLQQGIQQHGLDAVRAVFALKNSSVFRVNPSLVLVCPNCRQVVDPAGLTYEGDTYGGCCFGEEE
jgi:hypothetical protein